MATSTAKLPSVIHEFGINGDLDTGVLVVDTNSRRFANRCRRKLMTEISSDASHPYWRFKGSIEQIGILLPRCLRKISTRKLTDEQRAKAVKNLRSGTAKVTRKAAQESTQRMPANGR